MKPLSEIDTFLLDMDGTIYLSDGLIDGAAAFLEELRRRSVKYIFVTNNSSKSRYEYADKLKRLGLDVLPDDVFTSGEASVLYLLEKYGVGKVYVLGTESLEMEVRRAGFTLTDRGADFVLLGFDQTLTYDKIHKACDLIRTGTPFFATHPDVNCPLAGGALMPDTGAMIKLFEASTGISPEIIGKPHKPIIDSLTDKYGLKNKTVAMVGDRLETDILLGKNAGFTTILLLSGATSAEEAGDSFIKPDYVFSSIRGLLDAILGNL